MSAVGVKPVCKYDDSLDAFGVQCVGGFFGAVLTGVFCTKDINSAGQNGWLFGSHLKDVEAVAQCRQSGPGQRFS